MKETNITQNFDIRVYAEMWSLRLLIDLASLFISTCLFYIVKYLFYNPDLPESIDLILTVGLVFHLAFDFELTCKACILNSTETGGYELPWSHMIYMIFYDVILVLFIKMKDRVLDVFCIVFSIVSKFIRIKKSISITIKFFRY